MSNCPVLKILEGNGVGDSVATKWNGSKNATKLILVMTITTLQLHRYNENRKLLHCKLLYLHWLVREICSSKLMYH